MENNTFEIFRWDSVTCSKDNTPKPMIYVKPNIGLLNYFRQNNNKIWLKVNNTGSAYDGKAYYGIVEKSSHRPNYTPNFFNSTGMYVVTLQTDYWMGYPIENGEVTFLNGTISNEVPAQQQQTTELELEVDDITLEDIINNLPEDTEECKKECKEQCKATGKDNCDSFCTELCTDGDSYDNNKMIIILLVVFFAILLLYVINN